MPANLPSDYASQLLYSNYYKALTDAPADHGDDTEDAAHDAVLALVPRSGATKVYAANSGDWSTGANWYPNGVPSTSDNVLIGEGVTVEYDINAPDTVLGWVRVDGNLQFPSSGNTAIQYDTMVCTETSSYTQGTEAAPLAANNTSKTFYANNGPLDVTEDTFMIGRGTIWMGDVTIHGAEKIHFLYAADHLQPALGATSVVVSETPTGWRNGDVLIIGGNQHMGNRWNDYEYYGRACEEVTITNISGTTVSFTPALTRSHIPPPHSHPSEVLRVLIANVTRNVSFQPAVPHNIGNGTSFTGSATYLPQMAYGDGKGNERPHTMFMHASAPDVRWAEFKSLGRTSKFYHTYGICKEKTVSASQNVPLDGPYASGGVVRSDLLFLVTAPYWGWVGGGTLTVTGTDGNDDPQQEVISGTYRGTKFFKTVTSIVPSANVSGLSLGVFHRAQAMTSLGVRNHHEVYSNVTPITYDTITDKTNLQGRYPVHIHKVGHLGLHDPAVLIGLSVHESPGWLVAQHSSHAIVKKFVGYDFAGAGLVAESGNETGLWQDGCIMGGRSDHEISAKDGPDLAAMDPGRSGSAYWFTGRAMKVDNCHVSDCTMGFGYSVRFQQVEMASSQFDIPELTRGLATSDLDIHPISHFRDAEIAASGVGFLIVKAGADQFHDFRTVLDGFKMWSVGSGIQITYTAHYTTENVIAIGGYQPLASVTESSTRGHTGIGLHTNSSDQIFKNIYCEDFRYGIDLYHGHTEWSHPGFSTDPKNGRVVYDYERNGISDNEYLHYDSNIDDVDQDSDDLDVVTPSLSLSVARPVWNLFSRVDISGTKTDEHDTRVYPFGTEGIANFYGYSDQGLKNLLAQRGYWVNTADSKKYMLLPEFFSSTIDGAPYLKMIPVEVPAGALLATTVNNGSNDLDDTTPPVLADFEVTTPIGTPVTINVVSRATHADGATMKLGGHTSGFNSFVQSNSDGTLTVYPVPDWEGSEDFYVWVYDKNGNSDRATVTLTAEVAAPSLTANNDSSETEHATAVTFNVLDNDIGTGLEVTAAAVTGGASVGTVAIESDDDLTFTPHADFSGVAAGTYTLRDATLATTTGNW
jgi:hypothetical protein